MTRRGPRSVPVLLFLSLAFLDLTILFPAAGPVLEPAAGLALLGAVVCAAVDVTSPAAPRRPGADAAHPTVIPMQRRGDVAARR